MPEKRPRQPPRRWPRYRMQCSKSYTKIYFFTKYFDSCARRRSWQGLVYCLITSIRSSCPVCKSAQCALCGFLGKLLWPLCRVSRVQCTNQKSHVLYGYHSLALIRLWYFLRASNHTPQDLNKESAAYHRFTRFLYTGHLLMYLKKRALLHIALLMHSARISEEIERGDELFGDEKRELAWNIRLPSTQVAEADFDILRRPAMWCIEYTESMLSSKSESEKTKVHRTMVSGSINAHGIMYMGWSTHWW